MMSRILIPACDTNPAADRRGGRRCERRARAAAEPGPDQRHPPIMPQRLHGALLERDARRRQRRCIACSSMRRQLSAACQQAVSAIKAPARPKRSAKRRQGSRPPRCSRRATAAPPAQTAAPAAPAAPAKAAKAQSKKAQLAAIGRACGADYRHALPRHPARHRRRCRLPETQRDDVVAGLPARARRRRGRRAAKCAAPARAPAAAAPVAEPAACAAAPVARRRLSRRRSWSRRARKCSSCGRRAAATTCSSAAGFVSARGGSRHACTTTRPTCRRPVRRRSPRCAKAAERISVFNRRGGGARIAPRLFFADARRFVTLWRDNASAPNNYRAPCARIIAVNFFDFGNRLPHRRSATPSPHFRASSVLLLNDVRRICGDRGHMDCIECTIRRCPQRKRSARASRRRSQRWLLVAGGIIFHAQDATRGTLVNGQRRFACSPLTTSGCPKSTRMRQTHCRRPRKRKLTYTAKTVARRRCRISPCFSAHLNRTHERQRDDLAARSAAFTAALAARDGVGAAVFTVTVRARIRAGIQRSDQGQRGDKRDKGFLDH